MTPSPDSLAASETPYTTIRGRRMTPLAVMGRQCGRLLNCPPKIALVVGTFAAVPYVHLHLEARRRLYPDIPMLVHDDHSPKTGELTALCGQYGADVETTATRFPPCKGDLSAFVCGLVWARECGADVLVKMSRRFIPKIRWVDGLASLVGKADYATYSSWTTSFNFGFRTECMALAVGEWFSLGLVDQMIAAIHSSGAPFVEGFMHGLARQAAAASSPAAKTYDVRVGERPKDRNGYAVWPFIGTDRRERSADHLWHDAVGHAAYHDLANAWGLKYSAADFADPNMGFGAQPGASEAPVTQATIEREQEAPARLRAVVYTICHNEEVLMPYFVRNYSWAERIVIYDDASTDRTREVLLGFPSVELRPFDSGGIFDEGTMNEIRNNCWKECRGQGIDFVVVVDADEFVWADNLSEKLLRWKEEGFTLLRPTGYDMISEKTPTGGGLLTAEVRRGRPHADYNKPCIFDPDSIHEIIFTAGCHDCGPRGEVRELRTDEIRLLHYRFLGADFYVERIRLRRARRSDANRACGWGFHYERSEEVLRQEYATLLGEAQVIS